MKNSSEFKYQLMFKAIDFPSFGKPFASQNKITAVEAIYGHYCSHIFKSDDNATFYFCTLDDLESFIGDIWFKEPVALIELDGSAVFLSSITDDNYLLLNNFQLQNDYDDYIHACFVPRKKAMELKIKT